MTLPDTLAARQSLRARMLVSASLVLVIFLGVMGLVLDNAYRQSAEESLSGRLLAHTYMLIAVSDESADPDAMTLTLPVELPEPQFNSIDTGLLGLVFDSQGQELWRSVSARNLSLTEYELRQLQREQAIGALVFDQLPAREDNPALFYLSYHILWQGLDARAGQFTYIVLQDPAPLQDEVASFRNNLWGWLVAGVVVLVALQAGIMSWGLKPIRSLERDIQAIEAGDRDYLEGSYPREIEGVTRNLNLLLEAERRQQETYRTTLADLAHSLKTPLAILKALSAKIESAKIETPKDAEQGFGVDSAAPPSGTLPAASARKIAQTLDEQTDRMNEIVSWQLERAVLPTLSLVKQRVPVAPLLSRLVSALGQVHPDVHLATDAEPVIFAGDERDLMEMLGNLLDNACKYGQGEVRVEVRDESPSLVIQVEDNGPGIPSAERQQVLKRGIRLDNQEDQQNQGQGIGLAVVAELVARYQGQIEIDDSCLGGARVMLRFAAA